MGDPGESGRNVRRSFMCYHTESFSVCSVETLREGAVTKVGRSAPLLICVQSQGSPGPSGPRGEKGEQVWCLFSFWKWEMCLYMYMYIC